MEVFLTHEIARNIFVLIVATERKNNPKSPRCSVILFACFNPFCKLCNMGRIKLKAERKV